jgi:hypothetical protein
MFLFFFIVHNTFAATGMKRQHVNGELQMPTCVDACCNADHKNIDVNMKAATTVGHSKQTKGKMSFTFNMLLNNFGCQLSF